QEKDEGKHVTTSNYRTELAKQVEKDGWAGYQPAPPQNRIEIPPMITMSCSRPLIFAPGASAMTLRGNGVIRSRTSTRTPMRLVACALRPTATLPSPLVSCVFVSRASPCSG